MPNVFGKSLTLKEWMDYFGYHWVEGEEQLFKGIMGVMRASDVLADLAQKGAITK